MASAIKRAIIFLYFKIIYRQNIKINLSNSISKRSKFEGMNKLYPHALFDGHLGYGSYIGHFSKIVGSVGRFTSIAPEVVINPGRHPYTYPYATTSPAFFSLGKQNGKTFSKMQLFEESKYADFERKIPVIIGNDCWIGQRVFITGGVKIGDGAVILAGAVVTNDIPAYAIAGGVPAKVIKYRYNEETIIFLLKIKWWEKDISWFKEHYKYLCDIDSLKSFFQEESNSKI